jgi:oligopeptide/dipeptide ABC transporter ATP-binding protein
MTSPAARSALRLQSATPLLEIEGVVKHFKSRDGKGTVRAVDGVTLSLQPGETLGIVGESGSGKSTLGRLMLRLHEPDEGRIRFEGEDLLALDPAAMRLRRRQMQIIFQDPYASLDPRFTVGASIAEPLVIHRIGDRTSRRNKVQELLSLVGLEPDAARRYPHEFSGGQRQRLGIARAIALEPKLIVADEPVSALDVSIQSQVLNLLTELKGRLNLAYVFISHDLAVVEHISDRVAVMYLGRLVELAERRRLYREPAHPYTEALISAIPEPDADRRRQRIILSGDVPNPEAPPPGCPFHPLCPKVFDRCRIERPATYDVGGPGDPHLVDCHLHEPRP